MKKARLAEFQSIDDLFFFFWSIFFFSSSFPSKNEMIQSTTLRSGVLGWADQGLWEVG